MDAASLGFLKKKSCLTNLRIWCRHAAINNTNKSAKLKEINQHISRKKRKEMFYSPEGINQQSHSSPCYYPSTPESTPGWNSLVKFHFFAPFFILSIFQSPTWQKHNSLAGSGEMLRRGGVPHPPGGHAGSSQKRCHSPRSLFGT